MPAKTNQSLFESRAQELVGVDARFAREFRRRFWLDYRRAVRRILQEASPTPGDRVLDETSNDATLALQMVSRVSPGQVVSVCPIEEVLQQAYKQAQAAGLEEHIDWRLAAVEELPFPDESFDLVTCALSFRLLNTRAFIDEAYRLLAPGGRLVITELLVPPSRLNDWRLALRSFYYKHIASNQAEVDADFYSSDELADLLHETGFEPIIVRGLRKPLTRHSWVFSLVKAIKP